MKRVVLLILMVLLVPFVIAQDATEETSENPFGERNAYETLDTATTSDPLIIHVEPTKTQRAYYDFSQLEQDTEIGSISKDTNLITDQGTISLFSMTNSLFSLGSLIQGSFISFENNNNIYFKSIFDSSEFTATINKNGNLEVGQINGVGEMGKIVIEIENGNLTQDNNIVFIPSGNDPMYTYYNTTEIEFKDGNISYLGESVTNKDDSKESSEVNFDEN